MSTLAWLGAAVLLLWVSLYWAYTLVAITWLRPWLLRYRSTGVLAGLALLAAAATTTAIGGSGFGNAVLPCALGALLAAYIWRRQWLLPQPAPHLVQCAALLDADDLVAVLPNGDAVPLRLLARLRTARIGPQLIVHCALARSLAMFDAPPSALAAVLPHPSGFIVGDGEHLWDGVDGRPLSAPGPLHRRGIGLMAYSTWRQNYPEGHLFSTTAAGGLQDLPQHRAAPLMRNRALPEPMRWGIVDAETWRALPAGAELATPPQPGCYLLAHWAARLRCEQGMLRHVDFPT